MNKFIHFLIIVDNFNKGIKKGMHSKISDFIHNDTFDKHFLQSTFMSGTKTEKTVPLELVLADSNEVNVSKRMCERCEENEAET